MVRIKLLILLLLTLPNFAVAGDGTAWTTGTGQYQYSIETNADGTDTVYEITNTFGDLYNLYDRQVAGETGINGCWNDGRTGSSGYFQDDGGCPTKVDFGFSWEWHNESYTGGYMSTNGCFMLTKADEGPRYCSDYTPDQLNTQSGGQWGWYDVLFPFYTDLIGDNSDSALLYKTFDDYVILGWYNLREYYRDSNNSFEVYIYDYNDSLLKCGEDRCTDAERAEVNMPDNYTFAYGELDIIRHDVLIGEKKDNSNYTQYVFFDDDTNGNTTWDEFDGGYLESGGAIYYSEGNDGQSLLDPCTTDPLSSTECSGYAQAYFDQQCNLDAQYDSQCPGYIEPEPEVDQCDINPLSDPSCPNYQTALAEASGSNYDSSTGSFSSDGSTDYNDGYTEYSDDGYTEYSDDGSDQGFVSNDGSNDGSMTGNETFESDFTGADDGSYTEQNTTDDMFTTTGVELVAISGEDSSIDSGVELFQVDNNSIDVINSVSEVVDPIVEMNMPVEEFQQQQTEQEMVLIETYEVETYDVETTVYQQEENTVDYELYVAGAPEEEVWVASEEVSEEPIFVESEEVFNVLADEDEALAELISEDVLEELIEEESVEEIIEVVEEAEEVVVAEEQEEIKEEIKEEIAKVEKEASQATSSSSTSSKKPASQSVAIAQVLTEVSDDTQTVNVIENVISDGSAGSVQVDSGSQSIAMQQDDGSFNNTGSSGSESTGVIVDDSSQQQFEQVTGQVDTSIDAANTSVDVVQTSAFQVAEQQQEQLQEEPLFVESFDDGSSGISQTDADFGDSLTEALSTGTGLTEFLSQQTPNFQRFEVQNSVQEQRTTQAVESLADKVGSAVAQQNLQEQLQNIQDGQPTEDGGYADQTVAVAYIGYTAGFSAYTGTQVYANNTNQWYDSKQMPDGKIDDNKMGFYRMAGQTQDKLYKMVLMQYGINPDEDTGEK
jgi:hypothetical protein